MNKTINKYHQGTMEAVAAVGTVQQFAAKAGVTDVTVYRWLKKGVSALKAIRLERLTGVPREVILPEAFLEKKS